MRLVNAIEVYRREGPSNPTDGGNSARARATKVVHAFLTPGEIQELMVCWNLSTSSKAGFIQKLDEIEGRLKLSNFL